MKKLIYCSLAFIFFLCNAMTCDSDDDDSSYWKITDVEAALNADNSGENPLLSNDSIRKEAYAIVFKYIGADLNDSLKQYVKYSCYGARNFYELNKGTSFYYNEMSIICNSDFDNEHPAGSDVTNFFKVYPENKIVIEKSYEKENEIQCCMLVKSPMPGIHSFKIRFYENRTIAFERETEPVKLY